MIKLCCAKLCYFFAVEYDNPSNVSCFSNISDVTHSRSGPYPYSEFGTERFWNPAHKQEMHNIFSSITEGFCNMKKRNIRIGDIAVISDGEWQTYGIITNSKKSYRDYNYDIISQPNKSLSFLQVGDAYFATQSYKIIDWVRYGGIIDGKK